MRRHAFTDPVECRPLFLNLATGPAAQQLLERAMAIKSVGEWPHGFDRYRRIVYDHLTMYGQPDLPWPNAEQLQTAMDRGLLPGDFAASIIREDR